MTAKTKKQEMHLHCTDIALKYKSFVPYLLYKTCRDTIFSFSA